MVVVEEIDPPVVDDLNDEAEEDGDDVDGEEEGAGTQYGTFSDQEEQEMDMDELKRRIWRDRLRLRRLKKQQRDLPTTSATEKQPVQQAAELSRRKKTARAHDSILKYMLKMMDSCKALGFVYGFIPENGRSVSSSSDNIRPWWKEKVKFDIDGPAAVSEFLQRVQSGGWGFAGTDADPAKSSRSARCHSWVSAICSDTALCTTPKRVPSREGASAAMVADGEGGLVGRPGEGCQRTRAAPV